MLIRCFYILFILLVAVFAPATPVFCYENHLKDAEKRDPFSLTPELQRYMETRNPKIKQKDNELPEIRFAGVMIAEDGIMAVVEFENGETMSLKPGMEVFLLYEDDQKISFWVKRITNKEITVVFENGIESKYRRDAMPQSVDRIMPAGRRR